MKKIENKNLEMKYPKEALIQSQTYGVHRDLLSTILEDDRAYTSAEVDHAIEKFQKGMVR